MNAAEQPMLHGNATQCAFNCSIIARSACATSPQANHPYSHPNVFATTRNIKENVAKRYPQGTNLKFQEIATEHKFHAT